MNSAETIKRVPIHTDADGVVRVARTRVTLETIVEAFDAGATAEEIAQQCSMATVVPLLPMATASRSLRVSSGHSVTVNAPQRMRDSSLSTNTSVGLFVSALTPAAYSRAPPGSTRSASIKNRCKYR